MIPESSCTFTTDDGGNSLITHNINAEGTDEPGKLIQRSSPHSFQKSIVSLIFMHLHSYKGKATGSKTHF